MGAALWIVAPVVPIGAPPSFGSIEHIFLLMPLVAAPLALLLLSVLLHSGTRTNGVHDLARRAQPAAAAMVLASFFLPTGKLAAGLASGWLVVAAMVAVGGVRRAARVPGRQRASVSLLSAHVFLPIGAVWLMLARLGAAPRELAAMTVFLAALHFHFSGFTLQVLIAATGLQLPDRRSWLPRLHGTLAIGAAAGIPTIAAGNLSHSPVLKFIGVFAIVVSTTALAIPLAAVARSAPERATRILLLVSAAALTAGMILAAVYGLGELTGRGWIGIPRMIATHGALNAFGFTLFGLLGHLRLWR